MGNAESKRSSNASSGADTVDPTGGRRRRSYIERYPVRTTGFPGRDGSWIDTDSLGSECSNIVIDRIDEVTAKVPDS